MRWLKPLPIAVLLLTFGAITAVIALGAHADSSRREQLRVKEMTLALTDLQSAPFNARPPGGRITSSRSRPNRRR